MLAISYSKKFFAKSQKTQKFYHQNLWTKFKKEQKFWSKKLFSQLFLSLSPRGSIFSGMKYAVFYCEKPHFRLKTRIPENFKLFVGLQNVFFSKILGLPG